MDDEHEGNVCPSCGYAKDLATANHVIGALKTEVARLRSLVDKYGRREQTTMQKEADNE